MMPKQVQLENIPKSKKILKHINIADDLTRETGLEHGFRFCRPENKLIVDKLCIGTECEIKISPEKCEKFDNSFHTHPNRVVSKHSITDIYNSAYGSYFLNRPNIKCVKAEHDKYTNCEEINLQDQEKVHEVYVMAKNFVEKGRGYEAQERLLPLINDITKPKRIYFDAKTGKWHDIHSR